MKNAYNFLVLTALLILSADVKAQFEAGQSFVSGDFSTNINRFQYIDSQPTQGVFNYNIGVSWGQFTQANRSSGWELSHALSTQKSTYLPPNIPSLQQVSFGGSRFIEFYKPLSEKFALYLSPSIGLTYILQNNVNQQNTEGSYYVNQTNTLILGASLRAGIAWRITPKWALYGNFASTNPINISGGVSNTKHYNVNTPVGAPVESKGSAFGYNFTPNLNTGSIGLGFRYFYTRNQSNL